MGKNVKMGKPIVFVVVTIAIMRQIVMHTLDRWSTGREHVRGSSVGVLVLGVDVVV